MSTEGLGSIHDIDGRIAVMVESSWPESNLPNATQAEQCDAGPSSCSFLNRKMPPARGGANWGERKDWTRRSLRLPAESGEEMEGGEDARVRESRLVKMVEGLKRRLEQLKAENEQLEELLHQADARVSGGGMPRLVWRARHCAELLLSGEGHSKRFGFYLNL